MYSDPVTQTSDSPSIKWWSRATALLADPVGLYIATLDRDAVGTWEVSRGSEDKKMILRASFIPILTPHCNTADSSPTTCR